MFIILVGCFVGLMCLLVLMVVGMLDLLVVKFIMLNIIGCLLWLLFYFLSGILVGVVIDIFVGM